MWRCVGSTNDQTSSSDDEFSDGDGSDGDGSDDDVSDDASDGEKLIETQQKLALLLIFYTMFTLSFQLLISKQNV